MTVSGFFSRSAPALLIPSGQVMSYLCLTEVVRNIKFLVQEKLAYMPKKSEYLSKSDRQEPGYYTFKWDLRELD